jgi:hypothetical protein
MTLSTIGWRALSTGPEWTAEPIGSILFVLPRFKGWPIATAAAYFYSLFATFAPGIFPPGYAEHGVLEPLRGRKARRSIISNML